jgi:hypothetical protein
LKCGQVLTSVFKNNYFYNDPVHKKDCPSAHIDGNRNHQGQTL